MKTGKGDSSYKKRRYRIIIITVCIAAFVLSPLFSYVRSLAVMSVYSYQNKRKSLLAEEGIMLSIPGGLATAEADWYPFVMTYTADEAYQQYTGEQDARLTILYNFPAFSYSKGSSRLYDRTSDYYNSFYGAYLVRDQSNQSLSAGNFKEETAAEIAKFDFFRLVLGDFGLSGEQEQFDFHVTEKKENVRYAGYDGWTRIGADITVNGSIHNKRKQVMSYLQYGSPSFGKIPEEEEFAPVPMSGILYGRYFREWDVGVYFYIMGTNRDVCEKGDRDLLARSLLKGR